MSAKPAKYPQWATNTGATIEPPADQKAVGYGSGEQVSPKRMNWLFNTNYQWIEYFDGLNTAPRTVPIDVSSGQVWGSGSTAPLTLAGSTRYILITSTVAEIDFPLPAMPVGSTITSVTLYYNREGSASFGTTLARWSMSGGTETVIASHVDTTSSGDTSVDLSAVSGTALPYTTISAETYSLSVDGATGARIYGAMVTFTLPA